MINRFYLFTILIAVSLFTWAACSDSGTGNQPGDLTGESVEYELTTAGESSVSGKVTFEERIDGYTRVTLELTGVDEEEEYLVTIYSETAIDVGDLLIEFDSVDGSSGESVQVLSADEEGNTVTYEDLLVINAHIRVHPDDDTDIVLALIDIGENALTGESLSIGLEEVDGSGIYGEVEFLERASGQILAVIELAESENSDEHIARLYEKNGGENGELLFVFNSFDGETGTSKTNITELEDGSAIEFDDLEEFEAYLHVYNNESEMAVISIGEIDMESDSE